LWRQIQADVYGRPVEMLAAEEGGAFGAALLAAVGVNAWPSVEAACAATVHVAEVIEPKAAGAMDAAYARFRRVYPALREIGRA
jgi:xylulokinase